MFNSREYVQQVAAMSANERNDTLVGLWRLSPSDAQQYSDLGVTLDRRVGSDLFHIAVLKLGLLLPHAYITDSFATRILDGYTDNLELGRNRWADIEVGWGGLNIPEDVLLGLDRTDRRAGIFEMPGAYAIEIQAYDAAVKEAHFWDPQDDDSEFIKMAKEITKRQTGRKLDVWTAELLVFEHSQKPPTLAETLAKNPNSIFERMFVYYVSGRYREDLRRNLQT